MHRLAGEVNTQFLEDFLVDVAQQNCGMNLAALQQRKRVQGLAAVLVIRTQDRKGDQHLVCVKTRILAVQVGYLGLLDWFDESSRNEFDAVLDSGEMFGGLQE